MKQDVKRYVRLDCLRGVAIILVFIYHYYIRWPDLYPYGDTFSFKFLSSLGTYGVKLFFMISGFVILLTLEKCNNFQEFLIRRLIRLFPLMLLSSLIIYYSSDFFIERPGGYLSFKDLLPSILFIEPQWVNFIFGTNFNNYEGAFWSLCIEVRFYVIFGFLYYSYGIIIARNLLILLSSIFLVFKLFYLFLYGIFPKNIYFNFIEDIFFIKHIPWFIIGIICYEYRNNFKNMYEFFKFNLLFIMGTIAPILIDGRKTLYFTIIIIILFLVSIFTEWCKFFFSSKILQIYAYISYSFYLIHENIGVSLIIKFYYNYTNIPSLILHIFPIFIITLYALIITKYYDVIAQKYLKKCIFKK